jgi:hypothetical protein
VHQVGHYPEWLLYTFTKSFNIRKFDFLPTQYICVLCGSQNKQRLFPYTALTERFFITEAECVYCAIRTEYSSTIRVKFILQRNDAVRVAVVMVVDQLLIFCISVPFLVENSNVSDERTASFLRLSEPRSGVCGYSVIWAIRRGSHLYSFTLKIEAVRFSETSLHSTTTRCRNRKEAVQLIWLKFSTDTDCDFWLNPSTPWWDCLATIACFGELLQVVEESGENIFFKAL